MSLNDTVDEDQPKPRLRPSTPALYPAPLPERLHPWLERYKANLAQFFVGVTTEGSPVPGLFSLEEAGASTQPVLEAAQAFIVSLDHEQRTIVSFERKSDVWRAWCNMHPFVLRHGICLHDLDDRQRMLAVELLRSCMGETAFATARDIMRLNEHLREITGRDEEFGEYYYWISIMGTPSASEPWGWQIDGHHLTVSCFVCGGQLVLTPNFMGSEPVSAKSGKYAGTRVLASEEAAGIAVMQALDPAQQQRATIGMEIPADVFAGASFDNLILRYAGITYLEMTGTQQSLLRDLVRIYVDRIRPEHAAIKLREVEAHLDDTYFAWIGHHDSNSVFYYRVHNPVILIEFDHQAGVALINPVPTRQHIHTLVRTPNGNDFGQTLLRQRLAQSPTGR
jgi:hypothetical protein